MKYVSIFMPDCEPFGDTFLEASSRAIVLGLFVKSPALESDTAKHVAHDTRPFEQRVWRRLGRNQQASSGSIDVSMSLAMGLLRRHGDAGAVHEDYLPGACSFPQKR
jgi:hypothetical protein